MADENPICCEETVSEPPGFWHSHACGNKAKFVIKRGDFTQVLCGVHVRRWRNSSGVTIEDLGACRG